MEHVHSKHTQLFGWVHIGLTRHAHTMPSVGTHRSYTGSIHNSLTGYTQVTQSVRTQCLQWVYTGHTQHAHTMPSMGTHRSCVHKDLAPCS